MGAAWTLAGALALVPSPAPAQGLGGDRRVRPGPPEPVPRDLVAPLVRRMDRYLHENEVDGVTMDWRYQVIPSEEIRQTVVCQVLAYADLYRLRPRPRIRDEIVQHADFLLGRLREIRSYTPFDGMLAYCLLAAYETTGEDRFLTAGEQVTTDLLAIPTGQCVLNGGLMVAMATAEFALLTGRADALQKTHDILDQLAPYQNADGSFPHWCVGSRDIHYTGWMSMELIHLERLVDDVNVAPILARATAFLAGRVAPDGRSIYEQPCSSFPGCTEYYYSRATGCGIDYDTRGWTVEPAYMVLALDHAGLPETRTVLRFLLSLEKGGTFADLYGYWPPPEDPEYPWTIADTSVVNMSVIFWAMTTALTDRVRRGYALELVLDDEPGPPPPAPLAAVVEPPATAAIEPNPAPGACTVRFTLARPADVRLAVYDAGGRCLRVLESRTLPASAGTAHWDGRDAAGRPAPTGVYFARLEAQRWRQTLRFVLVR